MQTRLCVPCRGRLGTLSLHHPAHIVLLPYLYLTCTRRFEELKADRVLMYEAVKMDALDL